MEYPGTSPGALGDYMVILLARRIIVVTGPVLGVERIPNCRGAYTLFILVEGQVTLRLGRKLIQVEPGFYVYTGSAMGPGGVRARIRRHVLGLRRRLWWHIDRLLESGAARVQGVAVLCSDRHVESALALCLEDRLGSVEGFGSSDDKLARGHLHPCGSPEECVEAVEECTRGLEDAGEPLIVWLLSEPSRDGPSRNLGEGERPGKA